MSAVSVELSPVTVSEDVTVPVSTSNSIVEPSSSRYVPVAPEGENDNPSSSVNVPDLLEMFHSSTAAKSVGIAASAAARVEYCRPVVPTVTTMSETATLRLQFGN